MIKDLKMGIKMMHYCHNKKGNIAICIFFTILGIATLIVESLVDGLFDVGLVGGYFMMCAGLFPEQAIYQMSVSNLVLASPARKKMQTVIPVLIGGTSMLVMYLIIILITGIEVLANAEVVYRVCNNLIVVSFIMLIMMLYMVMAYKYFVVSVFAFAIAYSFLYGGHNYIFVRVLSLGIFGNNLGSFVLAAVIGLAVLIIAGFLAYLLSLLVYRTPISKMSMTAALRKEM